jgi:P22 coat protein - gene protein 5
LGNPGLKGCEAQGHRHQRAAGGQQRHQGDVTVSQAVRGDGRCVGLWHGCSCHLDLAADLSATTGNSAAQRTVHQAMSGSSAITVLGTASTVYLQNLVFHKNAFALAVVPMQKPAGAVDVARKSYKGLSVSVIPYYDGANDISNYRLDVLFGVKTLDGRLATWLSGSPLRLIERFVVVPLDLAPAWLACATPGSFCGANRLRTIGWSAV